MFAIDSEISLPVHKTSIPNSISLAEYMLGKVVQATVIDNKVYADLSDGSAPLGIVSSFGTTYRDGEEEMTVSIALLTKCYISSKMAFIETTHYDTYIRYTVNDILYVSDGKLTTARMGADHPGVAMVVDPPKATDATLRLLWL